MRFLKALAILIIGPLLGIAIGFIVGSLALPPDHSFAANGGHAAPGDGFAILPYLFISLVASALISIAAAVWVVLGKPRVDDRIEIP